MLNHTQKFMVQFIKKLRYIRQDQLWQLVQKEFPQITENRFAQDIRQLRHIGEIIINNGIIRLAGLIELDHEDIEIKIKNRIDAIGVMLTLSESGTPICESGKPPCELLFFLETDTRLQAFKVFISPSGTETEVTAHILTNIQPVGHIALIYIEDAKQIPLFQLEMPHFYVLHSDNGYVFLKDNS